MLTYITSTGWESWWIKLLIATIIGIVLGLERELKKKPLGFKTCIVIIVTSCLVTIVSVESATKFWHQGLSNNMPDPMRLTAQIIAGVSFMGTGAIIKKHNDIIQGLTTAALVWAAAGFGIAIGAGFYKETVIAFILIMFSVELAPKIVKKIGPRAIREKEIQLTIITKQAWDVEKLLEEIKKKDIKIEGIEISDLEEGRNGVEMTITTDNKKKTVNVYNELKTIEGIEKIVKIASH